MGLREDKKASVRARLYETAMELFGERGYDATRIKDIIERVGVSEATFFNYFPTKESLLDQSAAHAKSFYGAYLHNLAARSDEPVADRVRELFRVVGSVFAAERRLMASVIDRTSLFFGSTGATRELDLANFAVLAQLFAQGQASGEVRGDCDPLQLAEILNGVQILVINNWVDGWWGDVGPLGPRLELAADVVLLGCLRP